jgi:dolichol-phosphate mannosyltransferase
LEKPIRVFATIPTLNEARGVGWVINGCHEALKNIEHHIIVVDGYSIDETVEIAKSLNAEVLYEREKGYGAALMTGFNQVLQTQGADKNGKYEDIIIMMDGDSTYDPADIPNLLKTLQENGADLAIGNRFARMKRGAMTQLNRIGNWFFTALMNKLYGLKIKDSQSGMRAIKVKALRKMSLEASGMPLASEMLIEAKKRGLTVVEVPITYGKRVGRPKLQPLRDGWRITLTMMRLFTDFNPILTFSALSFLFLLVGAYMGIETLLGWYMWRYYGADTWPRLGFATLSAMFFTTSAILFSFGLLLDAVLRVLRAIRQLMEEIREQQS